MPTLEDLNNATVPQKFVDQLSGKSKKFYETMVEMKKNPLKVEDFMDPRIPSYNTADKELAKAAENNPRGIHNDKEMDSAWRFLLLMLADADLPITTTPLELITLYRDINNTRNIILKIDGMRKRRQECKSKLNKTPAADKETIAKLEAEIKQFDEDITNKQKELLNTPQTSSKQRAAIVQAVLVIGFLKEYILFRADKLALAETQVVWLPLFSADENKTESIAVVDNNVTITPGVYTFYKSATDALNIDESFTSFVGVTRNKFTSDVRLGEDRIDYIRINLKETTVYESSTDIVNREDMAKIDAPKSEPLITSKDVEEADKTPSTEEAKVEESN